MAIGQGTGREQRVLIADAIAARLGVRPGMRVSAAHALANGLQVRERNEIAEIEALERLANWAGQFSALISPVPPQTLLLEIQGSLALFGGLDALLERIARRLVALGYSHQVAMAPTPLAATWLARAGMPARIATEASLPSALAPLTLHHLDLSDEQRSLLYGMGLRTAGECLRLPRDGLARRLGADWVANLDRALGHLPDPRAAYISPASFEARLELMGVIENAEGLLFPLKRLVEELCGVLVARLAGVPALVMTLHHPHIAATGIELTLATPTHDAKRLMNLFHERLLRVRLPEPVDEIKLTATRLIALAESNRDFFAPERCAAEASAELIERLRARLGPQTVQGLQALAEHRPERAWRYADPAGCEITVGPGERPLWLLAQPLRLSLRRGRPYCDSMLVLEENRERIESGWWDGNDVRRDYFVARTVTGARLWVYHELGGDQSWWLHGVFG